MKKEERKDKDKKVEMFYKREFICALGGSFNPIHVGHVEMMKKAKEIVEVLFEGKMLQGFLAVAHDTHVYAKTKKQVLGKRGETVLF